MSPASRTPSAALPEPETELLVCCARTRLGPDTIERVTRLIAAGIDWDRLLRLAQRHGLLPLLNWNLNAYFLKWIPRDIASRLLGTYLPHVRYNQYLSRELLALLDRLEEHAIPALPFKGPVLAAAAYGNVSLRQFVDLDILVHPRDVVRARDILLAHGYQFGSPARAAGDPAQCGYQYNLFHENGLVAVELDWRVFPSHYSIAYDFDDLWARRETVILLDTKIPSLAIGDLLTILCAQGAKHAWERLEWVSALAELVRSRPDIDWEAVVSRAARLGGRRMLDLGLLLARDMLDAPIPEPVIRWARDDHFASVLAAQVAAGMFNESLAAPHFVNPIHAFRVQAMERSRDRWRYSAQMMRHRFTPTFEDREWLPLPGFLSSLYYIIRPFRLAIEYGPRLLHGPTRRA